MIYAIVSLTDPTGVKPILEFRHGKSVPAGPEEPEKAPDELDAEAKAAALEVFVADHAADPSEVAVVGGWEVLPRPPVGCLWSWDHDAAALVAPEELVQAKLAKCLSIDLRTDELIGLGFEFPPGGGAFYSLSIEGQMRLEAVDRVRNDEILAYPIAWNSLDDTSVLQVDGPDTMHNLFLAAAGTLRARVDSGSELKAKVRAAATVEEVWAVQDSR